MQDFYGKKKCGPNALGTICLKYLPPGLGPPLRQHLAPSELKNGTGPRSGGGHLSGVSRVHGQPPLDKEQARVGSSCCSHPWSRAGEGTEVCVCLPPDPQGSLSWERPAVTEEGEKIEGNTLISGLLSK